MNEIQKSNNVIFGDLCDGAKHHMNKYKHYAKVVTKIDPEGTNGYAFEGYFINNNSRVDENDFVLLHNCGDSFFYQVKDGKDNAVHSNSRPGPRFINKCIDYMNAKLNENKSSEEQAYDEELLAAVREIEQRFNVKLDIKNLEEQKVAR